MKINIIEQPEVERIVKKLIDNKNIYEEIRFLRRNKIRTEERIKIIENRMEELTKIVYRLEGEK